MNKEAAYAEGYQFGVKMALDSCGIVKTAAMPKILQQALEAASGMPGWAKGMAIGAPAGAGLGAIGGGDLEDILSGGLGGAAAGGLIGGAPAIAGKARPKIMQLLERHAGGGIGDLRAEAAGLKSQAAAEKSLIRELQGNPRVGGYAREAAGRKAGLEGDIGAAHQLMRERAGEIADPTTLQRILQGLGVGVGGAGAYGALSD